MGRKHARDIAFKCIYELEFDYNLDIDRLIDNNFENKDNDKYIETKEFTEKLVKGVINKLDEIDEIISAHLKSFTIDRISKVNLAALRIAIYEIKYLTETPEKVAINEAVEIAKTYGDEKSSSFVNGVLANIIKK